MDFMDILGTLGYPWISMDPMDSMALDIHGSRGYPYMPFFSCFVVGDSLALLN